MALSLPHPSPPSSSQASFHRLRPTTLAPMSRHLQSNLNRTKYYSSCRASWEELAGVLVFSAIPFTAVKAIANSPLGESLQRRMEETKKMAVQNSREFKALAEKARKER